MTRQDHLAECRWCRIGITCIEWYRYQLAGHWCAACNTDHWVTWEGEMRPNDIVTITWWASWSLIARPFMHTEHAYVRDAATNPKLEGALWIRGVFSEGPELDALLAAKALLTT